VGAGVGVFVGIATVLVGTRGVLVAVLVGGIGLD
jgi:hypothetical protein